MTDRARLVRSHALSDVAEHAYAAVVPDGSRLVLTAGACPLDADGRTVGVGDVAAQARQVMSNLQVALADAGADLDDVVRTTVYVASPDQGDLGAAWEVVRDAFAPHDPPSTLLGVAVLGYPDQLVEVDAVAAVPAPEPQQERAGVLQHRRRGAAAGLLTAAEERFAALGGSRADAMVLEGDDGAHHLRRAAGYAPQPLWRRWVEHLAGRSRR